MSEKVNIAILTEGSQKIGLGHITRCISLYQAFWSKGISPKLIVNGDKSFESLMSGLNYETLDWTADDFELRQLLENSDVAIVDSYRAAHDFYKTVSEIVRIPVYIDDYKRLDYPRGIVINVALNASDLDYPQKEGIRYLLGRQYVLLRKELWDVPIREERDQVESFLITFGGIDFGDMTIRTLGLLRENWPDSIKNVIVGPAFQNIEDIKMAADKGTRLFFSPLERKVKDIMIGSDIAISAAGQTLYELARIGVPTVAVTVAENQTNNVKAWLKTECILHAGWSTDPNILERIGENIHLLKLLQERQKISINAKALIDGLGAMRVAEEIIGALEAAPSSVSQSLPKRNST